jgi:hypothetical protein
VRTKGAGPGAGGDPGGAARDTAGGRGTFDGRFGDWFRRVVTFNRLEFVSITHSLIYFALLISWLGLGQPQPLNRILGYAHGIIWIAMAITSVLALRYRVVNLQLAVAVAVLGCVAPFFGSAEFLRQKHQMKRATES